MKGKSNIKFKNLEKREVDNYKEKEKITRTRIGERKQKANANTEAILK